MNFHRLLNMLVLTLSLSTVLITLLAYLIHKIRQLPRSSKAAGEIKIEGTYFRRYAPFQSQPALAREEQTTVRKGWVPRSAPAFFAVIAAVIFCSLFFEDLSTNFARDRKQESDAATYERLVKTGLLKKYDLNPTLPNPKLEETVSSQQLEAIKTSEALLKTRRVVLLSTAANAKLTGGFHEAALKSWATWLSRHGVAFIRVEGTDHLLKSDLLILPQATALSSTERGEIESLIKSGLGLIATGPIGMQDENGHAAGPDWAQKIFGVKFFTNAEASANYPSLFAADVKPWWNIGAGLLLNWFPLDNRYLATSTEPAAIYESNYQGRFRFAGDEAQPEAKQKLARAIFRNGSAARTAWLALDPVTDTSKWSEAEKTYQESALLATLEWSAGLARAKIASWKEGTPSALVVSVDSEDKFDGAERLRDLFDTLHTPATFFTVTNLLKDNLGLVKKSGSAFEIASHTDDHADLPGKTLEEQFTHVESARLMIEELTEKPLAGFRPPEEKFDETTLNAALQNKAAYFFGDQRLHRFAPISIAGGKLTYYPRSALDDFNILRDRGAQSLERKTALLLSEFERVSSLGGALLLNFHSQGFGQEPSPAVVIAFLKQLDSLPVWRANFRDMTSWWMQRQGLTAKASLEADRNALTVQIENKGPQPVTNFAVRFDSPIGELQAQKPEDQAQLQAVSGTDYVFKVPRLEPSASASFVFAKKVRGPAADSKP